MKTNRTCFMCWSGMLMVAALSLSILAPRQLSGAQAGYPDSFNPNAAGTVNMVKVQNDQNIVLAGSFTSIGNPPETHTRIARVSATGVVESSFQPSVNGTIQTIAFQNDNAILIGGTFSTVSGISKPYLARLYANGQLDEEFSPVLNDSVAAIAVQGDGSILIGGNFTQVNGVARGGLARLSNTGVLDASFHPLDSGQVYAIKLQGSSILFGGNFSAVDGTARNNLARVSSTGVVDAGFAPNVNNWVDRIELLGSTKILIAGVFTAVNGLTRNYFASLDLSGSAVDPVNPNADNRVRAIGVQSDGKIVLAGDFINIGGLSRWGVARLNSDGTAEAAFDAQSGGYINDMAIQADGKILVGGFFSSMSGLSRGKIARLYPAATGALLPEIDVSSTSGAVADGGSTSFGSVNTGTESTQTFTITNSGTADLTGIYASINGTNATEFGFLGLPATSVPAGGQTTCTVRFISSAPGTRTAALHITSNDSDESPYDINLSANSVAAPEITVAHSAGAPVNDGGSWNFGFMGVGGTGNSQSFFVLNTGAAGLSGLSISKDGADAADFTITTGAIVPLLGPNGRTTVTIKFTPSSSGPKTAAIHIASNDADENPFDITLTGTGLVPAQMTSPASNATLTSDSVTFQWDTGGGASQFALWVGNSLNAYDIYAGTEYGTSRTVTVPDDGRVLYVTLWTLINGVYQSNKYTYLAFTGPPAEKSQITSPANGSALTSSSLPLVWNAGFKVTNRYLYAGTTPGGYDLYSGNEGTSLGKTLNNLPADKKIHVTLWSQIFGVYQPNYYVFNPLPSSKAALTSPSGGSTLTGALLDLTWSPGIGASKYVVWIGSSPGGYDLGAADAGTTTSRSFGVPQDGGPVYVTLWSLINGAYQSNSYWFTTALPVSGNRPARLTSHTNAATLPDASPTFAWDAGVGATSYYLWLGSKPDGYDLFAGSLGGNQSKALTIPADGRRIYLTLFSLIGASYQSNAYYFNAPTLPDKGAAQITAPTSGSSLSDATLPLSWNSAAGASQYALWVGDAPSGYNRYAGNEGLSLSKTLTTMPLDGSPVYATLYSLINGAYLPSTAWFTTANTGVGNRRAKITSPPNGTTLTAAQTSFTWDGGTNVTNCALWIGSTPGAYDLLAAGASPNSNRTVTLPTDGRKIYVTLYSLIGGAYQSSTWFYTAASVPSAKATMSSPADGSLLPGASVTFNWNPGTDATAYALWIGRKPGGYDVYAGSEGTSQTRTINTMPRDGGPVYVTLWSLIKGAYQSNEYIYQAASP